MVQVRDGKRDIRQGVRITSSRDLGKWAVVAFMGQRAFEQQFDRF